MTDDKIERLDLTEVAAAKSKDGPNQKFKVAEQAGEQKPAAPTVSLKDAPLPKK
jgi:hypothetical protein